MDSLSVVTDHDETVERLHSLVESAESEVSLSVPAETVPELEPTLAAARERGVRVFLLAFARSGSDTPPTTSFERGATVGRWLDRLGGLTCVVDFERGLSGYSEVVAGFENTGRQATVFENHNVARTVYREFLTNNWAVADEVHAVDPDPLPEVYDEFRDATLQATLHLREGHRIGARAVVDGDDAPETVTGAVVNTFQSMVDPMNGDLPNQTTLALRVDDRREYVGGPEAIYEDYAARQVTLAPADD